MNDKKTRFGENCSKTHGKVQFISEFVFHTHVEKPRQYYSNLFYRFLKFSRLNIKLYQQKIY